MQKRLNYNLPRHGVDRVQFATVGPSKTEQEHKDSCDINKKMARAMSVGTLQQQQANMFYGDFSTFEDYQTARNKILDAESDFRMLPSSLRKRFDHDPANLIAFLGDEANRDEAIKLGIIPKPEPVVSQPVVTNPVEPVGDEPVGETE